MIEKFQLDELFEQATEDTSYYLWAVESLSDPPEGYDTDYLLMLVLAHRARSRLALELIDSEAPMNYIEYKERLEKIRQTAEEELNEIILNNSEKFEHIISTQLIERLNAIEELLQKVSKIAQDGDLMEDPDWVAEDLRETAHDFIHRFQLLALTGEELNHDPFDAAVNSKIFQDQLKVVDLHFQHSFGYFHAARDMLLDFHKREYGCKCWWFSRMPEPDDIEDDQSLNILVDSLKVNFRAVKEQAPEECLWADKTTAYALGELDPEEGNEIREHIKGCRNCLNLFLDVKTAEDEAHELGMKTPAVLSGLSDAIRKRSEKKAALPTKKNKFLERSISTTLELFKLTVVPMDPAMAITRSALTHQKKKVKVKNGDVLKSGDRFEIRFKLGDDAYVYILFKDNAGGITKLFSDKVLAGNSYVVHKFGDQELEIDHNTGQETILLLASESYIEDFDERIGKLIELGMDYVEDLFPDIIVKILKFEHK